MERPSTQTGKEQPVRWDRNQKREVPGQEQKVFQGGSVDDSVKCCREVKQGLKNVH